MSYCLTWILNRVQNDDGDGRRDGTTKYERRDGITERDNGTGRNDDFDNYLFKEFFNIWPTRKSINGALNPHGRLIPK